MAAVEFYKRTVDNGNGEQYLETHNGVIVKQWLTASQGRYTGDGNPELIGETKGSTRGMGFRKVKDSERERLLEDGANPHY